MKKIKQVVISFVLMTILVLPTVVYADYEDEHAFWTGGFPASVIKLADYYEDPSVASFGYSYWTANARADYAGISNANIGFTNVGNYADAEIRFFVVSYGDDYGGIMNPYTSNGTLDVFMTNTWAKAHVIMNDKFMDDNNFTSTNRHKTTIHELGHAFSMRHQVSPTISVMRQGLLNYTDPQPLDISNLQWKY
ncbi:hypothetical protein I6G82_06490 [Lysinibacillus macroides]|uniref:hypothetical protein n=1 Tax=Lysinibacillus macroides TaxID=33935 RepID=UPI0006B65436|nr:hypothetical protein [Lysinibacillus macroides]QPR69257.1 hypothetical protein I6G82_06490 [Lysinibacillus macroides]